MIVWVNGTFGVGKTQVTHELRRRLGRGWVADPELLGFAVHRMRPPALRRDFQDDPVWRHAVREVLRDLAHRLDEPVLVPMTLVVDAYADEILGGLADLDLRHVTLTARPETVRRRLRSRGGPVRDLWALQQLERCTAALAAPRFATHVDTDVRTVDEVVEAVADAAGLELRRPREPRARAFLRRRLVQLRHVR